MDDIFSLLVIALLVVIVVPIISLLKLLKINRRLINIEKELKSFKEKEPEVVKELSVKGQEIEQESIPVSIIPKEEEVEEPEPVFLEPVLPEDPPRQKESWLKKRISAFRFENLLSKIGIITLVLGIGFFVKYAIDKNWINEIGRVAIGLLTGGLLIAVAHKLRKNYNLFSAIMVGGGISVFYITITLAFREYQLFGQVPAFIMLIGVTLFSVALSLLYDRKELALFSLLGGYLSPFMISAGEGNYIILFSFLFILNSGMLLIAMRKGWRIIEIVSFFCTQLFYWGWLLSKFEAQYAGAIFFAVLFYLQFYLMVLFDHFHSENKITPFQVAVILGNNLSLFAASIFIFNDLEIKVEGMITMAMAVVNAVVMVVLFRKKTIDKRLIYLVIGVVLGFISLAIPVQLSGYVITLFWAMEFVLLLWLWSKTEISIFRIAFLIISVLTVSSYLMDVESVYDTMKALPVIFNRLFITGLTVVVSFIIGRYLLSKIPATHSGYEKGKKIVKRLNLVIACMAYLVPFFEIHYQFDSASNTIYKFTYTVLAVYTIVYMAVIVWVNRSVLTEAKWLFRLLTVTLAVYIAFALPEMVSLRRYVFQNSEYQLLFLIRYLSLPALAVVFYGISRYVSNLPKKQYTVWGWLFVIGAVIILSVELDNTVIQLWGNESNYSSLLYDVHTFGYPILWGILAMILMVWGLKGKKVLLRQISLGFFAFIILKFYMSDIWLMSQTGRIISFVILGIILLSVSFLIQKIKILMKEDAEPLGEDLPAGQK